MLNKLIENAILIIKKELSSMPNKPGVYRMIDQDDKILYIGKAKDLSKRITNYTQINRLCKRMRLAISQTSKLEIITTDSEAQALILEANLIKSLKPKYNILLTDDKSMPYILLRQDHPFAQIVKFRGKQAPNGQYFGPFASPKIVNETIEFLEKAFLLRNCSDYFFATRKNPCMQYQLRRCSAPCVGKINAIDYQANTVQALAFLRGKSAHLQQELSLAMEIASESLQYEKAARYRDQLRALNYIQNKNSNLFNLNDADVIGVAKEGDLACVQLFLFRHGQNYGNRSFFFSQVLDEEIEKILSLFIAQYYQNNQPAKEVILAFNPEDIDELIEAFTLKIIIPKKGDQLKASKFAEANAVEALKRKSGEKEQLNNLRLRLGELFNLQEPPKRIEVYDNSHISGAHAVGAMIVADEDGFNKKQYRKYNIKTSVIGDDYAMIKEVLSRRFRAPINMPDLLLIDGGQGQLSVAKQALSALGIEVPLVCISKGIDRNSGNEIFHQMDKEPFSLPKHTAEMKYLQILRDEAHRFAITTHRIKRTKAMSLSSLSLVPGIGAKRRKLLINHFTSIDEIKAATVEQLKQIDGISNKIALDVFEYFRS